MPFAQRSTAAMLAATTVPGGFAAKMLAATTVPGGFAAKMLAASTVPGGFAAGKTRTIKRTSNMKKTITSLLMLVLAMAMVTSCEKDDTDFSNYRLATVDDDGDDTDITDDTPKDTTVVVVNDTITIVYNGATATVTGDTGGYVTTSGAHVTVSDEASEREMMIIVSGSSTDGSLLVYRQKKFTLVLNGVELTNPSGPAINNQCGKALYVTLAEATVNTLTDGATYATSPTNAAGQAIDQKGTFFSEGQVYFTGTGTLNIVGNAKNGIASDDFIELNEGNISISMAATAANGMKVNDGITINGGTLTIDVMADGGRGIRSEARTTINGGQTTITTAGDCKIETVDGVRDTTSAAGIKCDSLFTMTDGTLTITSTGDGGKGINCDQDVLLSGGTLTVKTTGSNDVGKPKGIKSETAIIVSGGSLNVSVKKSWACDNGTASETPADHLTVVGEPYTKAIAKRSVIIVF